MTWLIGSTLWGRPGRTLLAILALVLGVAGLVAVVSAVSVARHANRQLYLTLGGQAPLEVVSKSGRGFDGHVLGDLAGIPGVAASMPLLHRPTILYQSGKRLNALVVGADLPRSIELGDVALSEGRLGKQTTEVVLENEFAAQLGIAIGGEVKILTRRGVRKLQVVGFLVPRSAQAVLRGGTLFMSVAQAQSLMARRGEIDVVQLAVDENIDSQSLAAAIESRLPPELCLKSISSQQRLATQVSRAAEAGLLFAALLIAGMAIAIVLQTLYMNVAERKSELSLLRAIGATRTMVFRLLITEGAVLGVIGGVLGTAAGLAIGTLLSRALEDLLQTTLPRPGLSLPAIALGMASGVSLAVLGTLLPACKASRIAPLTSDNSSARPSGYDTSRIKWLTSVLLLAVIAYMAFGWIGSQSPDAMVGWAFAAMVLFLLGPLAFGPLSGAVVRLLEPVWGTEGLVAHSQLLQNRTRTFLTIGVLFVSTSAAIGMANALLDNISNAGVWFQRTMAADFFVRVRFPDPSTGMAAPMPDEVGRRLAVLQGVKRVDPLRFVSGKAGGEPVVFIIRSFDPALPLPVDLSAGETSGFAYRMQRGEVAVGAALAGRIQCQVGDVLTLETPHGPRDVLIAGIVNEYTVGGLAVCLDWQFAGTLLDVDGADVFLVASDPARQYETAAALRSFCDSEGLMLHSHSEFRRLFEQMMQGVTGSVWVLLVVGALVAAFGVTNTLAMNVTEQIPEFELLRAVGMTRGQARKTVLSQALLIGVAGLLPGALGGIGLASVFSRFSQAVLGRDVHLNLRLELVVICMLFGLALVLAAALLPMERVARLQLARSLDD